MRLHRRALLPLATLLFATGSAPATDDLDAFITDQMQRRNIPGLSIAIIDGGKIVVARAYGVTDRGQSKPVSTTTLFQAGSISKAVAAMGALHLVEKGKLGLDADINSSLKNWKLPASAHTTSAPVTLRGLLSHTAGLTVHGFPGYATTASYPTLVQVLDGTAPANTAAIRNDTTPGVRWKYSGGGYTIMQQSVLDVTGMSFPAFMRQSVLAPLGMTNSSYEQPLPAPMAAMTAAGHTADGRIVPGRWHLYPEMAAAGLWTTATDLARFAIEIQEANAGKSSKVLSTNMVKQMLTDQKNNMGLGVMIQGAGAARRFNHNGRDEGFDAEMTATVETGQGIVIMINANDNSRLVARIRTYVANKYGWPGFTAYVPPTAVAVPAAELDALVGRYEIANNQMVTFITRNGRIFTSSGGHADEEFLPLGEGRFASSDRNMRFVINRSASGEVVGLKLSQGGQERVIARIGPLFTRIASQPDPDVARTTRITAIMRALGAGAAAIREVPGITDGVRKNFVQVWRPADQMRGLTYVGTIDVAPGVVRHESNVARVAYYRMAITDREVMLMVHLTADGLVADVDIVDE